MQQAVADTISLVGFFRRALAGISRSQPVAASRLEEPAAARHGACNREQALRAVLFPGAFKLNDLRVVGRVVLNREGARLRGGQGGLEHQAYRAFLSGTQGRNRRASRNSVGDSEVPRGIPSLKSDRHGLLLVWI